MTNQGFYSISFEAPNNCSFDHDSTADFVSESALQGLNGNSENIPGGALTVDVEAFAMDSHPLNQKTLSIEEFGLLVSDAGNPSRCVMEKSEPLTTLVDEAGILVAPDFHEDGPAQHPIAIRPQIHEELPELNPVPVAVRPTIYVSPPELQSIPVAVRPTMHVELPELPSAPVAVRPTMHVELPEKQPTAISGYTIVEEPEVSAIASTSTVNKTDADSRLREADLITLDRHLNRELIHSETSDSIEEEGIQTLTLGEQSKTLNKDDIEFISSRKEQDSKSIIQLADSSDDGGRATGFSDAQDILNQPLLDLSLHPGLVTGLVTGITN